MRSSAFDMHFSLFVYESPSLGFEAFSMTTELSMVVRNPMVSRSCHGENRLNRDSTYSVFCVNRVPLLVVFLHTRIRDTTCGLRNSSDASMRVGKIHTSHIVCISCHVHVHTYVSLPWRTILHYSCLFVSRLVTCKTCRIRLG